MANSQPYGDFLHLNRAALITRPRRLSPPTPVFTRPSHLLQHRQFIIHLISALRLIINQDKSDLIPSQDFVFVGMEFHSLQNLVRVPEDRVPPLLQLINVFLQLKTVTARQFLSLLGKLNAAADYVELGMLHLRPLQMSLLAQRRPQKLPLSHPIKISHNICHHLTWWTILIFTIKEFQSEHPLILTSYSQMSVYQVGELIWNQKEFYFMEYGHKINLNSISIFWK